MTKEEQWIKESIENYIFAYTGKRTKISDADAQHFTASVMSYLNLCTPSLPSDLDGAAAAHLSTVEGKEAWSYGPDHYDGKDVEDSFKAGAEWMAEQGWHDVTETPSIFGFYLVIHKKGWCVAYYMGKGVVCKSGWVEAIHRIEIENPQKWLDLRDLIPKKQ